MLELFYKVLHMSLLGGYCALLVLLIRPLLLRFGRKYAYCLWLMVFLNLCLPLSIEGSFSLIPRGLSDFSPSESLAGLEREGAQGAPGVPAAPAAALEDGVSPSYGPQTLREQGKDLLGPIPWEAWLCAAWLIGMAAILLLALFQSLRLGARLSRKNWIAYNSERRIALVEGIAAPLLWGLFRPVIYFPKGVEREERPYIYAHERCHRRRGDHILKLLAFLITAMHWFNPLAWLSYSLLCRDMEMACDEAVLERCGHITKSGTSKAF